jgi:hypothetical protein
MLAPLMVQQIALAMSQQRAGSRQDVAVAAPGALARAKARSVRAGWLPLLFLMRTVARGVKAVWRRA